MSLSQKKTQQDNLLIVLIAWILTLLISLLPDILFTELSGSIPIWLYWVKVGLIGALLLASLLLKRLHSLRLFFTVLLLVFLLQWGVDKFYQSVSYTTWLAAGSSFVKVIGAVQIPRATTGVLIVFIMLVLVQRFSNFFFVKGNLSAKAAPIPLIMTRPSSWRILGPVIACAMCLGLLIFTAVFGNLPSMLSIKYLGKFIPFILLFAASNAFGEEMLYRAPWLAALEKPIGPVHALLITAAFFGLGHYYGVPYGIIGVIMAFIPGWLMGKAMLETRGFLWAWIIHFCMDSVIFSMIALGSITTGG
jgi:membrane protease YdiL (CAAX protease family)